MKEEIVITFGEYSSGEPTASYEHRYSASEGVPGVTVLNFRRDRSANWYRITPGGLAPIPEYVLDRLHEAYAAHISSKIFEEQP